MPRAYRFEGHLYCPRCIPKAMHHTFYELPLVREIDSEKYLDSVAKFRRIDRNQPGRFTDTEFPKPLENEHIVKGAQCLYCYQPIEKEEEDG